MTFYFFAMLSTWPFNQYWLRRMQKCMQSLQVRSSPGPALPYKQLSQNCRHDHCRANRCLNSFLPQVTNSFFSRNHPQNPFQNT
jgi:hypothetical protein